MSIFFQYDNDNGTNGNVLTTALSGYATMTGTDPTYNNTWSVNGTQCAKYTLTGTYSIQTRSVPGGVVYASRYYNFSAMPSASTGIMGVHDSGNVIMGSVRVLSTGEIELRSATNTPVDVSSHVFVPGDKVRVEYHPIVGGTSEVRLFWNANLHGSTPDETLSGANGTAGTGTIVTYKEGSLAGCTGTWYADRTILDDAAYPAPVSGGPTTYAASGTVAAFSTLSGNPAINAAVPTPSLTTHRFIGAALATNGVGLLTDPARWGWSTGGFDVPDSGTFVPEGGGMRITWDPSPGTVGNGIQVGRFTADTVPLIPGHRIKVKFVVNVPLGSPDVSLINPFTDTETEFYSIKDRDMELKLFLTWEAGRNPMIGIQALTGGSGSVLVKRVTLIDNSSPAGEWSPLGGTVLPPPPPVDTTAPTTPGTPTDVITGSSVALSWTASTDNVGVTGYEVHRSATTGFTPAPGTLLNNAPSNSWTDNGVPVGTWYYKVIAFDAAGNKSTASAQDQAIVAAPPTTNILSGVSTQQGLGGITGWDGYRCYDSGRLYSFSDMTGIGAGQTRPKYISYSKQGYPFTGSYSTILSACLADLNAYYYTGGSTSQTHSGRWGIQLFWLNGNENYAAGEIGTVGNAADLSAYQNSMRALYDACHYIDPSTGQRRFPDAFAGSNPTQDQERDGLVEYFLHGTARYHDFVDWSMYPPGRNSTVTDPTYNWPSFDEADVNDLQDGFLLRPYRRTSLARAQARIDLDDPTYDILIGSGEIGIPSDPDDNTTRPYYIVKGWFGACKILDAQYGLTTHHLTYWDNLKSTADPHNKFVDEGPTSDHATGQATPVPSSAVAFRDWQTYHPDHGGAHASSWTGNPKAAWNDTGTPL